jgi:hypothetical protein
MQTNCLQVEIQDPRGNVLLRWSFFMLTRLELFV